MKPRQSLVINWYSNTVDTTNIVTKSIFDALSIGSGLEAAVLLWLKKRDKHIVCNSSKYLISNPSTVAGYRLSQIIHTCACA